MKKIKFKMPAFSLAEALITLLIVCLITLASIPVLTKKKRSPNEFASGKWMCTLNSKGQYVVYSSSDPHGDIKDPETWRVSQNGVGCTFTPPQNAKNFGVTVIGGGGGGRDGTSSMITHMNSNVTSYVVQEDHIDPDSSDHSGRFRLAVIGAGGGGHGSDDQDDKWKKDNVGIGGQGGAGAYWIGEIKLIRGESLTSHVGTGGEGECDGGVKCSRQYGPNRDSQTSYITLNNQRLLTAGGGGNGESTRNRGGHSPDCGNGGIGGNLTKTSMFNSRILSKYTQSGSQSYSGRNNSNCKWNGNYCNKGKYISGDQYSHLGYKNANYFIKRSNDRNCFGIRNGVALGDYYNNSDNYYYGEGGFGCNGWTNSCGMRGNDGLVRLWQIIEKPGLGGEAAKLAQYTLPNIKGKLKITIGKGGNNNANGEQTVVDYINNQNSSTPERTLIGTGGNAGAQGRPTSALYADGGQGQNSLWLNKGGGTVGKCQYGGFNTHKTTVTEQVPETDGNGEPICLVAAYLLGPADSTNESGKMRNCPLNNTTNPKGFCAACDVKTYSGGLCEFQYKTDSDGDEELVAVGTKAKDYETKTNFEINKNISYYKNLFSSYLITSWNLGTSANLVGYEFTEGEYTCLAQKMKTITYEVEESSLASGYNCSDSGNGTYFGAGGGGGSTTSIVGMFGKGGKGAPGAVIIEW